VLESKMLGWVSPSNIRRLKGTATKLQTAQSAMRYIHLILDAQERAFQMFAMLHTVLGRSK